MDAKARPTVLYVVESYCGLRKEDGRKVMEFEMENWNLRPGMHLQSNYN